MTKQRRRTVAGDLAAMERLNRRIARQRAKANLCECGHPLAEHQTGLGPWTGFCADTDCKCEEPTTPMTSQISIAILTPQQRKDTIQALTIAIDDANDRVAIDHKDDYDATDFAQLEARVNRWVDLINLIGKEDL